MPTFLLRIKPFLWSAAWAVSTLLSGTVAALGQPPAAEVVPRMVAHAKSYPSGQAPHSFDATSLSGDLRHLPIGIFDSGIGGLTVMEAILALDAFDNDSLRPGADGRRDFENERFVYLGDQANMPYGNYAAAGKEDYLRELILKDVTFLLGRRYFPAATAPQPVFDKPPVKAIVIACNTATAYGLEDIRTAIEAWQLPVVVVGVVEAGAQEVASSQGANPQSGNTDPRGTVAVLATVGTCSSMAYPKAIGRAVGLAGKQVPQVIQQGSVRLAEAIEGDSNAADKYIRDDVLALLESYRREGGDKPITTVVLGCTHFPLVQDEIAAAFERFRDFEEAGAQPYASLIAEEIRWIDPAELTAKALFRELAKARLRRPADGETADEEDLLFLSVPNPAWPGIHLDRSGGLDQQYKYGREVGHLTSEATRCVPMTPALLPASSLNLIRSRLPEVWKCLQ